MRGLTRAAKRAGEMAFNAGGGAVNWFPGHMAAASRAIRDRLKLADLVIEVRDARVSFPDFSSYSSSSLSWLLTVLGGGSEAARGARVVFDEMLCLLLV
nr:unnamed protein product [Digitaria exilis]